MFLQESELGKKRKNVKFLSMRCEETRKRCLDLVSVFALINAYSSCYLHVRLKTLCVWWCVCVCVCVVCVSVSVSVSVVSVCVVCMCVGVGVGVGGGCVCGCGCVVGCVGVGVCVSFTGEPASGRAQQK